MIHPTAIVEDALIGARTRIWAFAHVLSGATIGSDCNVCDGVFIEGNSSVGDRVTIKCGVQIWSGVHLEDDVFVGPNVTFTNDPFPRSKDHTKPLRETRVRQGASIGANATILPGLSIGRKAMVGAGAVVTQSVPAFAVVVGNPARIISYSNTERLAEDKAQSLPMGPPRVIPLGVGKVTLRRFKFVGDLRGDLSVGDFDQELPFIPKRHFLVFGVPNQEVRGEHAHRACHQFLIATSGSVAVVADDGTTRREVLLDHPSLGLYLPPLTWGVQYKYTNDAVLLVFASHPYDPGDYIRDYDEFLEVLAGSPSKW